MVMEKEFPKAIASLQEVFSFLDGFLDEHRVGPGVSFALTLAVEEFFTNMVKYDSPNSAVITVGLERQDDRLIVHLTDHDVDRFDVTKAGEVNTNEPIERRKAGGLGIHIAKRMVDSLSYDYSGRTSRITLVKKLESPNV